MNLSTSISNLPLPGGIKPNSNFPVLWLVGIPLIICSPNAVVSTPLNEGDNLVLIAPITFLDDSKSTAPAPISNASEATIPIANAGSSLITLPIPGKVPPDTNVCKPLSTAVTTALPVSIGALANCRTANAVPTTVVPKATSKPLIIDFNFSSPSPVITPILDCSLLFCNSLNSSSNGVSNGLIAPTTVSTPLFANVAVPTIPIPKATSKPLIILSGLIPPTLTSSFSSLPFLNCFSNAVSLSI